MRAAIIRRPTTKQRRYLWQMHSAGIRKRRAIRNIGTARKVIRQGGVKVDVWRNPGQNGDMYNTTMTNSYKDEARSEWKETKSFSPTDLTVLLAQLSGLAFQAITVLKSQSRGR